MRKEKTKECPICGGTGEFRFGGLINLKTGKAYKDKTLIAICQCKNNAEQFK